MTEGFAMIEITKVFQNTDEINEYLFKDTTPFAYCKAVVEDMIAEITEYLNVYAFVWQFDVVSDEARDTLKVTHLPEARRDLTVGGVGLSFNF